MLTTILSGDNVKMFNAGEVEFFELPWGQGKNPTEARHHQSPIDQSLCLLILDNNDSMPAGFTRRRNTRNPTRLAWWVLPGVRPPGRPARIGGRKAVTTLSGGAAGRKTRRCHERLFRI